jgi:hypothetical protein
LLAGLQERSTASLSDSTCDKNSNESGKKSSRESLEEKSRHLMAILKGQSGDGIGQGASPKSVIESKTNSYTNRSIKNILFQESDLLQPQVKKHTLAGYGGDDEPDPERDLQSISAELCKTLNIGTRKPG